MKPATLSVVPLVFCEFNWRKGMLETDLRRWVVRRGLFVSVALLWATSLERGVGRPDESEL